MTWEIREGDALAVLRTMESDSVDCVVTSPPYWGLRDYGVEGQMGMEPTPDAFLTGMVQVFREVRRVLKPTGTCWVNMGDSYAGARRGGHPSNTSTLNGSASVAPRTASRRRDDAPVPRSDIRVPGLKPKDLVGMPWRLALALQADGWWLRRDIIWHKPNPMPESVTDRPTTAHEYLFLLTKGERYHYEADAIREPLSEATLKRVQPHRAQPGKADRAGEVPRAGQPKNTLRLDQAAPESGRNARSVWTVATVPFPESHFATFPLKLVEPCILAGSPGGGRVMDPFAGSGTTGCAALLHGRSFIGIELNAEYAAMARRRISTYDPLSGPLFKEGA